MSTKLGKVRIWSILKSQEIKPKLNQTFADYPEDYPEDCPEDYPEDYPEDSSDIGRFGGGDTEKDDIEEDDFEKTPISVPGGTNPIRYQTWKREQFR